MASKKKAAAAPAVVITAYKGFDKDWNCRGFQFAVGETFTHTGPVKACEGGFHACEYPLDVLKYYPAAGNRFAVVEQSGDLSRHDGDSKVASRTIKVAAELNLAGMVKAAIEYTTKRAMPIAKESPSVSDQERGASSATGTRGASSATAYGGASSATGTRGASLTTGFASESTAGGNSAVAIATGPSSRARGSMGCAICVVYRDGEGAIVHIRASKVGDNGIKPDVFYTLDENGEFKEAA